jgi:hypothetical protein
MINHDNIQNIQVSASRGVHTMRALIDGLRRWTGLFGLFLLTLVLAGWNASPASAGGFTSGGGGSGGFTGRPLITIDISADKTSVPVNLSGFAPNPSLPYTSTITAVVKQDGRLFPTSIQFDLAPSLATGALFDPEDLTQGFRSLPLEETSGLGTVFFSSSTTPGTATITASAQDPNTGQTVSKSLEITVVGESRPATSMAFTGPYVNAVLAGQSRFGAAADTLLQNGSYSRVVSVVVTDGNGNPTNPNTQVNFYLIDGPITGYPNIPGNFVIAGSDGTPQASGVNFSAADGQFLSKDVHPLDRLVLSGGQLRTVQTVTSQSSLNIQANRPFNADSRGPIPYVIGRATNATILSPSFTNLNGVADTLVTYPATRVGQTAILVACTADNSACTALNTCDANGANCQSVFLGVTNGTDVTLTTSATELGPNSSTPVKLCLKDPNFTPLPATAIRYDMSSTGMATVKVNEVEGKQGSVMTGADGCATAIISSSGQPLGSKDIVLTFNADNVSTPVKVTIKGPGAGKLDGISSCQITVVGTNKTNPVTPPEGKCDVEMSLVDDNFTPVPGILITLGSFTPPGEITVAFAPAEGNYGKTDENGALKATVTFKGAGAYVIPFKVLNGTATYSLNFNLPAPTDKVDDPTTTDPLVINTSTLPDATVNVFYTALLQASGGTAPYTWSIPSGALPFGISLSAKTGVISGTTEVSGTFNFIVRVTDSAGKTALANLKLVVAAAGGGGGGATPAQLTLLTSSPELPSSDQNPVTLTAIARDSNGVLLKGAVVSFQVKSGDGTIQVVRSTTDETGTASALLSAGGNKRNRAIVVGATSGSVNAADVTVQVTGTRLNVSGVPSAVQVGDSVPLTFTLVDSADRGINGAALQVTVNDTLVQTLSTNTTGNATFTLTATEAIDYIINAAWDGVATYAATSTLPVTLSASPDSFIIETYDLATGTLLTNAPLDTAVGVRVRWLKSGAPVSGASIRVQTTKGTLNPSQAGSNGTVYVGLTNASGEISELLTIQSNVPGSATLSATGTLNDSTVAATRTLTFSATVPAQIVDVQAEPTTIGINTPPSVSERSTITAIIVDANGNPVANQEVLFTVLKDTSGGSLTASSANTNLAGRASVEYIAGSSPTEENGVRIQASIPNTTLTKVVTLTVAQKEVFITLGTGNEITEPNPTQYALPYNVLVNDIVGGPVAGANVILDIVPNTYYKGFYRKTLTAWVPVITASCANEDSNNNGQLDPGEDINNNGRLDPGNVATTSIPVVTTDSSGFGTFNVVYAQQYATWTNVDLVASTRVSGTEAQQKSIFSLPASSKDLTTLDATPPGQPSPFGVLPDCTISVDAESSLQLSTDVRQLNLVISAASVNSFVSATGAVTVTLSPSYAGATIAADAAVSDSRFGISVSPTGTTDANSQVVFPIEVSKVTLLSNITPGSYTVGTLTFSAGGSANAVVTVILQVTP